MIFDFKAMFPGLRRKDAYKDRDGKMRDVPLI